MMCTLAQPTKHTEVNENEYNLWFVLRVIWFCTICAELSKKTVIFLHSYYLRFRILKIDLYSMQVI